MRIKLVQAKADQKANPFAELNTMEWVRHCYEFVEVYAVFLVWAVVPLVYGASYLYLKRRLGAAEGDVHAAD